VKPLAAVSANVFFRGAGLQPAEVHGTHPAAHLVQPASTDALWWRRGVETRQRQDPRHQRDH